MNWKRLLCYIGWHKPVFVLELPEKAIYSGGPPLSIPIDDPWADDQFKGQVKYHIVCLWCEKRLKFTVEHHQGYIQEEK